MRIFAISDIHIDYDVNARWIAGLSSSDYREDVLILAGDVTDSLQLLQWCLSTLASRFSRVLFVPGNHDLWVARDERTKTSLQKFREVKHVATSSGVCMTPQRQAGVSIVPLFSWYDYSFGEPGEELRSMWTDFRACRWPAGFGAREIAEHFASLNEPYTAPAGDKVITFSHFLPRIDLMPDYIPPEKRFLYPVLGSARLDLLLRRFEPAIHVYGHSHVNRKVTIDAVTYINNAFGYPNETWLVSRGLSCIHEC